MANTTVYPFGQNGQLPSGYPIVNDLETGGADKALSAEMGKVLGEKVNEIVLGQTETYGEIPYEEKYDGSTIETTPGDDYGKVIPASPDAPLNFVCEYSVDLVSNSYKVTCGYGGTQTTDSIYYYDENGVCIGSALRNPNPGVIPATILYFIDLVYPDAWMSDPDTYKAQVRFIRIKGYGDTRPVIMYETWTIPQSILKRQATPNTLYYFGTIIKSPYPVNGVNDSTEIAVDDVVSAWGVMFPASYRNSGKPTPVIAMLHGSDGYVSDSCLGYTSADWQTARGIYLNAGFAVMDVNGWGVSQEADTHSQHWGNPLSVETLDKAFDFLKQEFNVCEKLLIHGQSMGGALAMSYALTNPGKVAGLALFAPAVMATLIRYNSMGAVAWGYADDAAAAADGYSNLTGFVPLNDAISVDSDGLINLVDWSELTENQAYQTMMIDHLPFRTRVWLGTSDLERRRNAVNLLVSSLRRGGSPVTIRYCNGAGHGLYTYGYVRDEAVDWFRRFVTSQM